MDNILALLGSERYIQYSQCLTDDALMVAMYSWAGVVIAISLMVMSICLLIKNKLSRTDFLSHRKTAVPLYAALIALYGLQQLTGVFTLFWPVYRLDILVTAITAGASLTIAYASTLDVFKQIR